MVEISKRDVRSIHSYVERIQDLLEQMSMDEDAKHFIDDDLMDRHYQVRDLTERMLEKVSDRGEIY